MVQVANSTTKATIFPALLIALAFSGCRQEYSGPEICYSQFYSTEQKTFRNAFTPSLDELHDAVGEDYLSDEGVFDIPIAMSGTLYVMSSCEYALTVERVLAEKVKRREISEEDYERAVDLASQSGRIIRLEPQ